MSSQHGCTTLGQQSSAETDTDCFHCDMKSSANAFCLLWKAWVCKACEAQHHQRYHPSCAVTPVFSTHLSERRMRTYSVCLTRFDGRRLYLVCRLGEKLRMEKHELGTYLYGAHGMTLVLEQRATINERIVQGLRTIAPPPKD